MVLTLADGPSPLTKPVPAKIALSAASAAVVAVAVIAPALVAVGTAVVVADTVVVAVAEIATAAANAAVTTVAEPSANSPSQSPALRRAFFWPRVSLSDQEDEVQRWTRRWSIRRSPIAAKRGQTPAPIPLNVQASDSRIKLRR